MFAYSVTVLNVVLKYTFTKKYPQIIFRSSVSFIMKLEKHKNTQKINIIQYFFFVWCLTDIFTETLPMKKKSITLMYMMCVRTNNKKKITEYFW